MGPLYKNLESSTGDNEEELQNLEDSGDDQEEERNWDDWTGDGEEGVDDDLDLICLFCDSKYNSSNSLFEHCHLSHSFDFRSIRTSMKLDFYGCFKLHNYIRSQVAQNRCWSCGSICESRQELQDHLHLPSGFESGNLPWDNDMYLKPYMEEDNLLYSFDEDEEVDDDDDDMIRNIDSLKKISIDDKNDLETYVSNSELLNSCKENIVKEVASITENSGASSSDKKRSKFLSMLLTMK